MPRYGSISFLTDYGLDDGFVAACHGVMAAIAADARVIDVTHLVPPGDVRRGAVVLSQVVPYLPVGVHVAVVDPGVGTDRRGIAVTTPRGAFVGPDNGLLPWAADAAGGVSAAFELTNTDLLRQPVSRTFHGRDIFAPVAAHLAVGVPPEDVGPALDPTSLVRLPPPLSRLVGDRLESEVLTVDRFGNLQLASSAADLATAGSRLGDEVVLHAGEAEWRIRNVETFGAADHGDLLVYEDSAGLIAVAMNRGDAAMRLGVGPGQVVTISAGRPETGTSSSA